MYKLKVQMFKTETNFLKKFVWI